MVDTSTQKPLHVSNNGTAGPYIRLPFTQVDEVRRLLDDHKIFYWVEENVISFDGGPEIAVIDFGRNGDPAVVQDILDRAQ
jgi:hypothetical protein